MSRLTKQEMWAEILEFYKLRRNVDAAEFFGVTPQTMYSRVKAGNIDFEEIYAKCPEISPDWLLSGGEGEIARKDKKGGTSSGGGYDIFNAPPKGGELTRALEALRAEQEALVRAQEQISGLIDIIRAK